MKKLTIVLISMLLLCSCNGTKTSDETQIKTDSKTPDETQIKTDLIGETMRLGGTSYEIFNSPSNFKKFEIKNKNEQGNIIEYDIFIVYEDTDHGSTDRIDAKIVYKKSESKWIIASKTGKLRR